MKESDRRSGAPACPRLPEGALACTPSSMWGSGSAVTRSQPASAPPRGAFVSETEAAEPFPYPQPLGVFSCVPRQQRQAALLKDG